MKAICRGGEYTKARLENFSGARANGKKEESFPFMEILPFGWGTWLICVRGTRPLFSVPCVMHLHCPEREKPRRRVSFSNRKLNPHGRNGACGIEMGGRLELLLSWRIWRWAGWCLHLQGNMRH